MITRRYNLIKSAFAFTFALITFHAIGQISISTSGSSPDASAMLDVSSTTRGLLIPRMSTTDRNAIGTPATSLMIYNTTSNTFNYWNGTTWISLAAGNIKELSDADMDTKVEVEKNPDEDKIRFTIAGYEIGILDPKCFQLKSPGQCVFIGESAGANDDGTINSNTFIGFNSGMNNISGGANTFIGNLAGQQNVTGAQNTFIGKGAGQSNTSNNNTFLGYNAGFGNTSGFANTFIGSLTGGNTSGSNNTFVGQTAGDVNTSGAGNTFIGKGAGDENTTANDNTFVGLDAGGSNVSGTANTFVGQGSGDANIASNNTFIGKDAGGANTSGLLNTFIGKDAGKANTTGSTNTFVGAGAGALNTAGANTFIGQGAGTVNVSGTANTFVGHGAGDLNIASNNTFIGDGSGGANTSGDENTFVGKSSGTATTTGNLNSFFGHLAGDVNTNGIENTFIGADAGGATNVGDYNVFVGQNAGIANTGGSSNTCIGENANLASNQQSNSTSLGKTALSLASNEIRVGNSSVTTIEGQVNFTSTSDARFKRNIIPNVPGLEFISRLKPVTYTWDIESYCRHTGEPLVEELAANRAEASAIVHTGFLAQDVEAAADEIGFEFSGIKKPKSEQDTYGLAYAEFTVPLVKAVQEQQTEIQILQNKITELTSQLQALEAIVNEMKNK